MKLLEAIKATLRMWLCQPEDTKPEKPDNPSDPAPDYDNIRAPIMPTGNKVTRGFKFLHPALRENL